MKPRTKKILNFAFIFGTLAIVLLIGVNGQEVGDAINALKSVAPKWLIFCALAYAAFVGSDALSIHYYLRGQGYPVSFPYAVYVSVCGAYYSNITPGATGGQPMQVYYLTKRDVPIGIGTSTLTVKFFCFQFMLMVFSTLLWLLYGGYVAQQLGSNIWILILGYVYNDISVCLVLLMAVNKRLVWWIIKLCIRLAVRLHLCKNPDAVMTKCQDVLDTFHSSVMSLRRRPMELLMQMLLSTVQLLSLMTVTFFIYRAFDLTEAGYWQIITLAVLLYVSAAYTPLPGASGAQEGIFALYFSGIFPDGIRLMALLLWRFFTYYIALIVGAVITVWRGIRPERKAGRKTVDTDRSTV